MKTTDLAQDFLQRLEKSDFTGAEGYLAYDFIYIGSMFQPLGKRDYMDFMRALITGMPDLAFNPDEFIPLDNQASVTLHLTGTHTNDIPPLFPGMPEIRATGKRVALSPEQALFTVRGDRITQLEVESDSSGGVQGILEQLGVEIPVGFEIPIATPTAGERL